MLNEQTERQVAGHLGRAAYNLHVLVVEPSTISPYSPSCQARLDFIRELYPRHKYSMVPFHSIFQYDPDITNSIQQLGGPSYVDDQTKSHSERLDNLRASILTATSKDDIDNLLLIRLVVAFAKRHGCKAVAWGDSDSRLAAKTLANVAKGRGASLTWQVCDGPSPWGLHFCFPLRGLYRSELQLYVNQVPELENMVIIPESPTAEISNRNLSIDELMNQYILTQGEKYPGVMANVVRTVNKLQPASTLARTTKCVLCAAPLGLRTDPTASGADIDASGDDSHGQLCHGCTRARADFIGPGNR
jgi:cytoplasmic tRNA 2-thiolation protein 2